MNNETALTLSASDTTLALALLFCILLLGIGFKDKTFWLLAGPVWIVCGLAVFLDYDVVFMFVSVGIGLVLLLRGAYDVYK